MQVDLHLPFALTIQMIANWQEISEDLSRQNQMSPETRRFLIEITTVLRFKRLKILFVNERSAALLRSITGYLLFVFQDRIGSSEIKPN